MHDVARIIYKDGMLMLPSKTPYEIEVVLGAVDWYAKQHGQVRLEVNHHEWIVASPSDGDAKICSVCNGQRTNLTFMNGARAQLCTRCARAEVRATVPRWPWPSSRA